MHRNGTRKRDRFLSDEEIRALWSACSGLGTYGALVKVLLLTGQRRAKWLA
jgi:integrase